MVGLMFECVTVCVCFFGSNIILIFLFCCFYLLLMMTIGLLGVGVGVVGMLKLGCSRVKPNVRLLKFSFSKNI